MPNKTLYVRPEDEPVWALAAEQAKREGRSLSRLVADALQRHVAANARRDLLDDLTADSIEAGTYDKPSEETQPHG